MTDDDRDIEDALEALEEGGAVPLEELTRILGFEPEPIVH